MSEITNDILSDIVKVTKPRFIRITARWNVRGGIYTNVVAEHRKKGWKPAAKNQPLEVCNGFEGSASFEPQ